MLSPLLPVPIVTPGESLASDAKSRSITGSSSIWSLLMMLPIVLRVVSRSGASAATVTSSLTPPSFSVKSTVPSCPTRSTRRGRFSVPKPDSAAVSS